MLSKQQSKALMCTLETFVNDQSNFLYSCLLKNIIYRDCLPTWIWHLMTCTFKPKQETQPVFNFFCCPNDFITQKVYFSPLTRVYVGLILLSACTQSRPPCCLLVSSVWELGHFFRYLPLLPVGWRIVQILRHRRRKRTNAEPTTLS